MTSGRPKPTAVFHFTHIGHLPSIAEHGLVADVDVQGSGYLLHEAGDPGIKDYRRRRAVDAPPGGVVGEYVPFYFAPRSPMMFRIHKGGVPEYGGSDRDLAYLVTSIERIQAVGASIVVSDRNAAKSIAEFSADPLAWDDLVDWPLMKERYWADTQDYPDRKERRMAECLVHRAVPWATIEHVVVYDEARMRAVEALVSGTGRGPAVAVRPDWYF